MSKAPFPLCPVALAAGLALHIYREYQINRTEIWERS